MYQEGESDGAAKSFERFWQHPETGKHVGIGAGVDVGIDLSNFRLSFCIPLQDHPTAKGVSVVLVRVLVFVLAKHGFEYENEYRCAEYEYDMQF
ncbi:MAG: hypothetical protein C4519_04990, partial [Desulfobacteraceae bacterium]